MALKTINIKVIRIDGGTQARVEIDNSMVAEYADAIREKVKFPPMVVFHDGTDYWLADGFHRWHAYNTAGKTSAEIDVRDGTLRDAVLFSLGANGAHGLRRSNADKRKSVESMLADVEWATWSDHKIADACGVSQPFVSGIRTPKPITVISTPPKKEADKVESDSSQPASKPDVTPAVDPESYGPDAAELEANAAEERAYVASMEKVIESDDKMAAAAIEIKRLNSLVKVLESRNAGLMNEKNEAIRMAKSWQRKYEQASKEAA